MKITIHFTFLLNMQPGGDMFDNK